ncbi:thermonuclease family protein [Moorena sp. SIO2C4]|uniref:thermonuclease family protein n=1 Tax=Moorena sp. SIO2C4 TaxID=2607824 RepID=UPI0013C9B1D4|nr:thermonuclease family protein [Moorena sp. SIO2C4]NES40533.1 hypothetical protein [Moorena sp. SIO2C4]
MHKVVSLLVENLPTFYPCDFSRLEEWRVVFVYDGDTFLVSRKGISKTIRLAYIDTAETRRDSDQRIESINSVNDIYAHQFRYGDLAKDFAFRTLLNKKVRIKTIDIDRYDRSIAEVYLLDQTLFQIELVRHGLASVYYRYLAISYDPLRVLLVVNEYLAKTNLEGFWSSPQSVVLPDMFRRLKRVHQKLDDNGILAFNILSDRILLDLSNQDISHVEAQRRMNSLISDT